MLITQLLSQEVRNDARADRSWFDQSAGGSFLDIDVGKTAVAYHDNAHAIVSALKQFDIGGQVLRQQIIARKRHHRHFNVRIDGAGADAGKVFQTTDTAGALQFANVNRRVAEDFAGRTAKGTRVQTIGELTPLLSDDRHHRGEVNIKPEHAQQSAGNLSECSRACQVAMLSNGPRGRHRRKNQSHAIDEAAFLIDSTERNHGQDCAYTVEQLSNLFRGLNIAPK